MSPRNAWWPRTRQLALRQPDHPGESPLGRGGIYSGAPDWRGRFRPARENIQYFGLTTGLRRDRPETPDAADRMRSFRSCPKRTVTSIDNVRLALDRRARLEAPIFSSTRMRCLRRFFTPAPFPFPIRSRRIAPVWAYYEKALVVVLSRIRNSRRSFGLFALFEMRARRTTSRSTR